MTIGVLRTVRSDQILHEIADIIFSGAGCPPFEPVSRRHIVDRHILNIYGAASNIFHTIPLFCPYFETPAGLFGAVDPDQPPERAEISQAYSGFPHCVEIRLKEAVRLNILDYGQAAAHALVPAGARISDSRVPVRRFGEIYPKLEVTFGFWIVDRLTGFRFYPILRTAGGQHR